MGAKKAKNQMASPFKSYVLPTLLFFLVVKLVLTGLFFLEQGKTFSWMIWESNTALAKDEHKPQDKGQPSKSHQDKRPSQGSQAPDLAQLQDEIASLEAHLQKINKGIEKYVNSGASVKRVTPETLEQKRLKIEKERLQLDEERQRLDGLKKEIDKKIAKLSEIQNAVQATLNEKKTVRDNRLKHLIKIYTTMPPKKAAMLIDKLEMGVVIALFSRMKGDNVGQILPYVSPAKAAKISERLAKLRQ